MAIVSVIFILLATYLLSGLLFAIPFLIRGVAQIDPGAKGSSWGFRLIILPGVLFFWPVLLRKWIRSNKKLEL